jgi:hypothetical protein
VDGEEGCYGPVMAGQTEENSVNRMRDRIRSQRIILYKIIKNICNIQHLPFYWSQTDERRLTAFGSQGGGRGRRVEKIDLMGGFMTFSLQQILIR